MSLRITQSMIFARALNDIRNSSRGILRVQEEVSSGRRINRPSDDPASMLRLLPLNAEILDFRNLLENSKLAQETLNTGAAGLEGASSTMARVRELLVQASNGTVSNGDRESIGLEIEQLLEHMVSIANSQRGNSFLFGGTRTETPPFRIVSNAGGKIVVYDGSHENHEIDVAPGVTSTLFTAGDRIFQAIDRGPTVIEGDTGAKATTFKDTGRGFDILEVSFRGLATATLPTGITAATGTPGSNAVGPLNYSFSAGAPSTLSIGGGPPVNLPVTNGAFQTASGDTIILDVAGTVTPATGTFTAEAELSLDGGVTKTLVDFSSTSVVVKRSFDGSILNVNVSSLSKTGSDDVTYTGTFDVFTVLLEAGEILKNTAGLNRDQVLGKLTKVLGEVQNAHEKVLTGLQDLGTRSANVNLLKNRLDGLILSDESARSNLQDSDLAESISEMTQKQFSFQASLQVSARIVQTTLLSFLR